MIYCPKCNKKVKVKNNRCPKCQKLINQIIFKDPIIIKEIPLIVKPVKYYKEQRIFTKIFASKVKIATIILFFLVTSLLITNISFSKNNEEIETNLISELKKLSPDYTKVYENLLSENNELFIYQDDDNYFWYNDYNNKDDTYYIGKYNYKIGKDALEELGLNEKDFYITYGKDIKLENIYSMNLIPTLVMKNQEDITNEVLRENESYWFLLILKNDSTAIGYNKTLNIKYNFVRTRGETE